VTSFSRRHILGAGAIGALAAAGPGRGASAAGFPTKPVTIAIGNAAGGPTDALMRAMSPKLMERWGQPVVVENRAGASEILAAQFVAKAPSDGHTLLLATEAPLTMNQFLFRRLPYDPEGDFASVSLLLNAPLALAVPASSPANSLQDFIAMARSRGGAKPLSYGSAGAGTPIHLPMVMFAKQNGLEMVHVPYRGLAPALTDLISGRIDAAWGGLAAVGPYLREGRLKALVVDAPGRVRAFPDIPAIGETGIPSPQASFIFALVAPTGTPLATRERLAADLKAVLFESDFNGRYVEPFGYIPVGATPGELDTYLAKDRLLQAERVRLSGATLD
jgi:tripartite-type tricarboxylate transporter receptor subunit TctC